MARQNCLDYYYGDCFADSFRVDHVDFFCEDLLQAQNDFRPVKFA
jgi:hypothetical protein